MTQMPHQELYDNGLIEADFFADEMMQIAQCAPNGRCVTNPKVAVMTVQ